MELSSDSSPRARRRRRPTGDFCGIFFSFDRFFFPDDGREGHTKNVAQKRRSSRRPWKNAKKKMTDAGNTDEENPYEIVVDEEYKGDLGDGNSQ